jgi:tetratricopeptide (TPR) repeat protein
MNNTNAVPCRYLDFLRGLVSLSLGLACTLSWTHAQAAGPKSKASKESPAATLAGQSAENTSINSSLTGELMLEILLGELNNEEGVAATGFSLILDAARKTEDPGLFKRAVEIALQARSGPSALEAARAWKSSDLNSKEANRFVLDILLALNKVDQTEEPLRTDLMLTPQAEQPQAIAVLPQLFRSAKDSVQASAITEQALKPFITRADTASVSWISLARMRFQAKQNTSALEALKKGLQLDSHSRTGALVAIELAVAHTPNAEELVKSTIASLNDPLVSLQWVKGLIEMDRLSEAATQIKAITESSPEFADAWLLLAGLELEQGSEQSAQNALKRYIDLGQKSPDSVTTQSMGQAYLMLAQIAQKHKDESAMETWLSKIEDPQLILRAQYQRASVMASKGKIDEAVAFIGSLPTKNKEDERSKTLAQAQLLRDYKYFDRAYAVLSKFSQANPGDVDAAYELAMVAERLKNYAQMEKILRNIISTHPDYAQAYNALGFSLADRGLQLAEAKKLIVKALEFSPEDPFITDSLGWVEFKLGNPVEALAILSRAYAGKADPEIAAHLGEVMWGLKKTEEANKIWNEGLQMSPDNEALLETMKRLKK